MSTQNLHFRFIFVVATCGRQGSAEGTMYATARRTAATALEMMEGLEPVFTPAQRMTVRWHENGVLLTRTRYEYARVRNCSMESCHVPALIPPAPIRIPYTRVPVFATLTASGTSVTPPAIRRAGLASFARTDRGLCCAGIRREWSRAGTAIGPVESVNPIADSAAASRAITKMTVLRICEDR